MIYRSKAMADVVEMLSIIAQSWSEGIEREICVYLSGETGVGKSLCAVMLANKAGLKVVTDSLAASTDGLLGSKLYGHTKGSFTGAYSRRQGLVDAAGKGVLFLDEVDSLNKQGQAMFLELLQERTFKPVGSTTSKRAECSFVFAAQDLKGKVQAGDFRSDLYFRVAGIEVNIPPLRSRPEDIEPLWRHFAPSVELNPSALKALKAQDWPGNVRQLEAVARRCVLLKKRRVSAHDLELGKAKEPVMRLSRLPLEQRRDKVYLMLRRVGVSAISALASRCDLSLTQLRGDLNSLWKQGRVEIYGSTRTTKYMAL